MKQRQREIGVIHLQAKEPKDASNTRRQREAEGSMPTP